METFDRETGEHTTADLLRLKSISAEGRMIVFVGAEDANEVSQLLPAPRRVLLTQDREAADGGIEIDSDRSLLVLHFRAPVLPETVDAEMNCDSLGG